MVFNDLGQDILKNAWGGYNATLFAYGQTGAGKSYSVLGYGPNKGGFNSIGCPRIIRTCIFPQLSVLRWNHWRYGYQNFLKYSSKGEAKCHTPPKSSHDPVQSLFPVSAEDLLFPLCSSTKQAIIDKGRIFRFHNRAIDFIFAGGPANKVRN